MLKRLKKILFHKSTLKIMLVGFIALAIYMIYLNHVIVSRFEQRRWNLPSRVWSDTYPLFNGQNTSITEIEARLKQLNYRFTEGFPKQVGQYNKSDDTFTIHLHKFLYPNEEFKGMVIKFTVNGGQINELRSGKDNTPIPITKLEPELIASIFDDKMEDRTFVALKDIPRVLTDAVILIEDERFYSHFGVDPIGIMRAFFTNVVKGRLAQGGSTLTQQMVKNFFLSNERTIRRKVNEALMALIIDARYSKEDILEVYLNEIYFGQKSAVSVTGVEEASKMYFSKSVSQINANEAAILAAMIKAPGLYSPFINSKNSKDRRNIILKRLLENKSITKNEYDKALNSSLPKKPKIKWANKPTHFIDFVKKQIQEEFSEDTLSSEGLQIFTTLDMYMQREAQAAVKNHLDDLEKNRSFLKKNVENGKSLEGSLVSINPKTGFIRAYIGGRNYSSSQFDILNQSKRQIGSTIKPFVYMTALDDRVIEPAFTLGSMLEDNPIKLKTGAGPWTPKNYDHKYHGFVRFRQALEKSYNVSTVWLSQQIGLDNVVETLELAGLGDDIKPYPSLVLGALEVSPLNLAAAYTVFPNEGIRSEPISIRRIMTPKGEVLEKKSVSFKQAFPHNITYLINQNLKGVIDHGTGARARSMGFSHIAAGKTGTTSDYRDAWFVGYTPDLLSLVWVGYHDNSKTNLSGASGALPVWATFMKKVIPPSKNKRFRPSDDIIIVPIDTETGLLHHKKCGLALEEYYIEGTEPVRYCHKQ